MWIFTNKGFLSIVQHRDKPDTLLVRSRFKGHIESIFPSARAWEDLSADYRYRAEINRQTVADALFREVMGLTYDNFKDSIKDRKYHDACSAVWMQLRGRSVRS